MTEEYETVKSTFQYKIPMFLLGVAVGMFVVWVAFQWVPAAYVAALARIGG